YSSPTYPLCPRTSVHHVFICFFHGRGAHWALRSFPTRRSSDLVRQLAARRAHVQLADQVGRDAAAAALVGEGRVDVAVGEHDARSEEHTSELQSLRHLVCRLLLEKKQKRITMYYSLIT